MSKLKPVPEGHHTATPYLIIKGANNAIEFYKRAFGATELTRLTQPDGRIGHAEIQIGDSPIMLADEFGEMGYFGPETLGGTPVSIHLYVEDVDRIANQAIAAGAKVLRPLQDQFYGERSATLLDPYGHRWLISTRTEEVSVEEMQKRLEAFMKHEAVSATVSAPSPTGSNAVRQGFHTITPYLLAKDVTQLAEFVKQAFGATETFRATGSAGGLHIEVKIGDSMVMMGGAEGIEEMPVPLHLYVSDTDAVYQSALRAGAASLQEPTNQPYDDREASVKDRFGNLWYIATHLGGNYLRQGFHSVTLYLHPRGAPRLIQFLKQAFEAEELFRVERTDGSVRHARIRIGDSMLELGEPQGDYPSMPATIFLYMADTDVVYRRALEAGATSIKEPADQPFGDRMSGVKDASGNLWYIATHTGKPQG